MCRGRRILLGFTLLIPGGCGEEQLSALRLLPPALANAGQPVTVQPAMPYADRGGQSLLYDLYRPSAATGKLPLVVLVAGDGWRGGSRDQLMEFAYDLAANGYAAATIDYRLVNNLTHFPAPVVDVTDAVLYFRSHAEELNVDPDQIALFGASAGAHLALMAALPEDVSVLDPQLPTGRLPGVKAVVDLFGPTDLQVDPPLSPGWLRGLVESLLGQPLEQATRSRSEASPINYVRPDGPAVFIVHGTADWIVPVSQARDLVAAMEAVGQEHRYIEIAGMEHTIGAIWAGPFAQSYRADLFRFLAEHLQARGPMK